MLTFLIVVAINALTLFILSKIPPLGIEIDSAVPAFLAGAVIGVFNGVWGLFPRGFRFFTGLISLGLVPLIGSIIVFGLSAWLVQGFRLRWGLWSAIIGAIAFAIVNSILYSVLNAVGLIVL